MCDIYIALSFLLRHLFGELYAAENMEMKMHYGLTAVLTAVGDDSVAVSCSRLLCNGRDIFKDV